MWFSTSLPEDKNNLCRIILFSSAVHDQEQVLWKYLLNADWLLANLSQSLDFHFALF